MLTRKNHITKTNIFLILAAVLFSILIGFGSQPSIAASKKVKASSIKISATTAKVSKGLKFKLKATVSPKNASDKRVKWSSSNPKVAKVDQKGNVTALKTGSAVIKVTLKANSKKSAKCKVTVINPKTIKYSLKPDKAPSKKGDKFTLSVVTKPKVVDNLKFKWSSTNSAIASVNQKGQVTVKGYGSVNIKARAVNGRVIELSYGFNLSKPSKIKSIAIRSSGTATKIGDKVQLTVVVNPSSIKPSIKWSSSNTSVATVSGSGVVTFKGAGTVKITAKTGTGESVSSTFTLKEQKKVDTSKNVVGIKVVSSIKEAKALSEINNSNLTVYDVLKDGSTKKSASYSMTKKYSSADKAFIVTVENASKGFSHTIKIPEAQPISIKAETSVKEMESPSEFTKSKVTVYSVYKDGSKTEIKDYSTKISEDSSGYYIISITKSGSSLSTTLKIKKKQQPLTITDIAATTDLKEAASASEILERSASGGLKHISVTQTLSDGSKSPLKEYEIDVNVDSLDKTCFLVSIATKDHVKKCSLRIKIKEKEAPSLISVSAKTTLKEIEKGYIPKDNELSLMGKFSDGTEKEIGCYCEYNYSRSDYAEIKIWPNMPDGKDYSGMAVTLTIPLKK